MTKSIYLINPQSDFPTYYGAEVYAAKGFKPATQVADLAIATVAAMACEHLDVALCDQNISPVDLDTDADFIGITGKVTQWGQMAELTKAFRKRGKVVLIGGPYASLCPEIARPHCDILVKGEIEEIAPELFSDLRAGCWKPEYIGTKPDLRSSPLPKWGLYPNDRAIVGTLQTSRGCPFECEFCDVIQYLGRKQRHKPISQVLAELDELYRHGYRAVFLCDDNFTAYRSRTKELLTALTDWNLRQQKQGKATIRFSTQASIDAARDEELLTMCAAAGLKNIFVGIETPNVESLRETKKRQNVGVNLTDQIQRFLDHGICITAGMIVGFDADGLDIFERQRDFSMAAPVPIFTLGALVAPAATPLHDRMQKEGRLISGGSEVAASPWNTNIVLRQMTSEQLMEGMRWLCNNLYHPQAFSDRVSRFINKLGAAAQPKGRYGGAQPFQAPRPLDIDCLQMLSGWTGYGAAERKMMEDISRLAATKPEAAPYIKPLLAQYMQIRFMYESGQFWEPYRFDAGLPIDPPSSSSSRVPIPIVPSRQVA